MKRIVLAALVVALAIVAVLAREHVLRAVSPSPMQQVVALAEELDHRPLDVRITGGFAWRPRERVVRASVASTGADDERWRLAAAVTQLRKDASASRKPDDLHALGTSELVLLRIHAAIVALEDVLRRETGDAVVLKAIAASNNAALLSDLAAAYLLRGQSADSAHDVLLAAECAVLARRADPALAEAAWNRAVAFETIGVAGIARAAWRDFLALDGTSAWAVEGRQRLRELKAASSAEDWATARTRLLAAASEEDTPAVQAMVEKFPEQSRTLVEEDLLAAWAEKIESGDATATRTLAKQASSIATAVASVSHDALAFDATRAAAASPQRSAALTHGLRTYAAARQLFREGRHPEAQPLFADATASLRVAGNSLALRSAGYDLVLRHYLGRNEEALRDGTALLTELGDRAAVYPTLAGQLHWTCGLAAMALGSLDDAIRHHRASLAAFERTDETSNLAGVTQVLAADARAAGDGNRAWTHQLRSFALMSRYATPERMHVVVSGGALQALRDGYPALADELQRSVLKDARGSNNPVFLCDLLVRRGELLASTGRLAEARAVLDEALAIWPSIPQTAVKSRLRADLEMTRAAASADLSARIRVEELDRALDFVRLTNSRSRIAKVLLLRGRAHRDAGDEIAAESDLVEGIAEVETQRERTTTLETRLTFLNAAAGLYDELIVMRLRRGDESAAFDLLERRRARWLLDRFDGRETVRDARVQTEAELRSRIPPGVAVVSFAVSRKIDAWVLTAQQLRHFEIAPDSERTASQIASWREALAKAARSEERLAGELSSTLLDPLRPALAGVDAIVFVPDRELNAVPFAALRDTRSGRRLIEDYGVAIAPSVNLYVRSAARYDSLEGANGALIVANPASSTEDQWLPPLKGAEAEAAAIAATLPQVDVARGAEATLQRFVSGAKQSSVVHFAGHALINSVRPEFSALVLAPDRAGRNVRLYARDIHSLHLPRTRLVVLAACESAGGDIRSESPLTLATAFIAAGAPVSMATLWPVDDAHASVLIRRFYASLGSATSPAVALREAQLHALRTRSLPPSAWAAFQVYGGPPL